MPSTVVVDVSGFDAPAAHIRTLLSACTSALRSGTCVLAEEGEPAADTAILVSVISADALHFVVRIEPDATHPASSRLLDFRPVDELPERWRSVGLAVAGLVGETHADEAAPPAPPVAPATKPAVPATPPPDTAAPKPAPEEPGRASADVFRLAVGLATGPGAKESPWRLGGFLTVVAAIPLPSVFAVGTARYAVGDAAGTAISLEWTTLGLGAGISRELGTVALRAQFSGLLERVAATAEDPTSGTTRTDRRWLPGALVGFEGAWPAAGPVGGMVAVEAQRVSGGTAIKINNQVVGETPPFTWGLRLGLELRL